MLAVLDGEPVEPLKEQRKLKKEETVIAAFDGPYRIRNNKFGIPDR